MASTDRDDDRVSLAPLDPETALRALLTVKPDDDAEPNRNANAGDRE